MYERGIIKRKNRSSRLITAEEQEAKDFVLNSEDVSTFIEIASVERFCQLGF